jgi:hypothetical protein
MSLAIRVLTRFVLCSLVAASFVALTGAKGGPIRRLKLDPAAERVDLFTGMEDGSLEVRVVPRDEFQSSVFITNKSDKPLTVVAPQSVAAAHVLKQFQPPGQGTSGPFGQILGNGQNEQGNGQSVGGQLSPYGSQGSSGNSSFFGSGSFFFSVPADKTVQVALNSVCLDHGKRPPASSFKYELRRLEDHAGNPALVRLFQLRDLQKTDRKVVQAAAWHLSSELSFASMTTLMSDTGIPTPMFTGDQLRAAKELAEAAKKDAPLAAKPAPVRR